MSRKDTDGMDNICPLCSEEFGIYAVGVCEHPVCYKCSARMRVLCEDMCCAICRGDLPKVIITRNLQKFESVETYHYPVNRKFKIYFENDDIQQIFYTLLEHRCTVCAESKTFRQFSQFRDHMRKEHQLFACELCVNHIKVFTHQFHFYDRKKLAEHRRIGDKDDKSHKGHPNCRFCDERYFDKDELVRHLRKDHFFCHFCEADGISNVFFPDHESMTAHYRNDHFLCEDGDCQKEKFFTNAFRSDIDYKAHKATAHSKHLNKALHKAARTLDVELNFVPLHHREEKDNRRPLGRGRVRIDRHKQREEAELQHALTVSLNDEMRRQGHVSVVDKQLLNPQSLLQQDPKEKFKGHTKDFPNLEGDVTSKSMSDTEEKEKNSVDANTLAKHVARSSNFSVQDGSMGYSDFPTLGGVKAKSVSLGKWASQQQSALHHSAPNSPQNRPKNTTRTSAASATVRHAPARPYTALSSEDFPSLGAIGNILMKPTAVHSAGTDSRSKESKQSGWHTVTGGKPEPEMKSKKLKSKAKKKDTDSKVTPVVAESVQNTVEVAKKDTPRVPQAKLSSKVAKGSGKVVSMIPARDVEDKPRKESDVQWQHVPAKTKPIEPQNDVQWQHVPAKTKPIEPQNDVQWQHVPVKTKPIEPQKVDTKKKPTKDTKKPSMDSEEFPVLGKANVAVGNTWVSPDVLKSIEKSEQWQQVPTSKSTKEQQGKKKKKTKSPVVIDDQDFPVLGKATATPTMTWGPKEVADVETNVKNEPKETGILKLKVKGKKKSAKRELTDSSSRPDEIDSGKKSENSDFVDPTQNGTIESNPKVEAIIEEIAQIQRGDLKTVNSSSKKSHLTNQGNLFTDDFPVCSKPSAPPGFKKPSSKPPPPPPGLSRKTTAPPPGFVSVSDYIKPASFSSRNQYLISTIQLLLENDDTKFSLFKLLSGEFRKKDISAATYYARCCDVIGSDKFHQVLPELLVLLPDISRQQELLAAFKADVKASKNVLTISRSANWMPNFHSCEVCGQVLCESDILEHCRQHCTDADFPTLGTASTKGIVNMGSYK